MQAIPDIRAARLVRAADGGVAVRVVAAPGRPADEVATEVRAVALRHAGLLLGPADVEVVHLEDVDDVEPTAADPGPPPPSRPAAGHDDLRFGRVTLDGVLGVRHGMRYTVEVTLHHDGRARTGSADGAAASGAILRLVTEATIGALAEIRPAASRLAVEATTVARSGERPVALVTLALLDGADEEVLVGSALVRDVGVQEAVARAALDATNRRLQLQG